MLPKEAVSGCRHVIGGEVCVVGPSAAQRRVVKKRHSKRVRQEGRKKVRVDNDT